MAKSEPVPQDRLKRVETRLTRLMLALGVDPFIDSKVYVDSGRVCVVDLSVAAGEIEAFLRSGKYQEGAYDVFCKGNILMTYKYRG